MNINELKPNTIVKDEVYAVDKLEIRHKKNNEPYLKLTFSDSTGRIDAIMWDNIEPLINKINAGDIARLNGSVGEYNKNLQITLRGLEVIKDVSPEEAQNLLPSPPIPIEEMYNSIQELSATIKDQHLQRLLQMFWLDKEIQELYKLVPGGKKWHHPYRGGLLHHTLTVMKICDAVSPIYPQINRDELLCGAIFHDVGKTKEFKVGANFDYSTSGRLIGHIHIGDNLVANYINRIPDFPEELGLRLRHIILSHHGEQGDAPVMPMTLEACFFYPVDLMDSQVNAYTREMSKAENEDQPWTDYVNLINRFLYRGNRSVKTQDNL